MLFDAIVLAGGRSRRLGGVDKTELLYQSKTLLEHAVDAVAGARHVVVVGPERESALLSRRTFAYIREEPVYAGPVAAVGAGLAALRALASPTSDAVVVLAADLVRPEAAVSELLAGARHAAGQSKALDGFVALDSAKRRQYLLACYRTDALVEALEHVPDAGLNRSMRELIDDFRLGEVSVSVGLTDDVDTWDDVQRNGVSEPALTREPRSET